METISQTFREKDAEKLVEYVTEGSRFKSWLVQGLPGGGIDYVFKELSQRVETLSVNQAKIKVINIDFSSLWTASLNLSLIQHFIKPLPLKNGLVEEDTRSISYLLDFLRVSIKSLSDEGWQFVYIFNHFDSVLKFPNLEEIQELLNTFQSLCYESRYSTSNIVECYRDIEDLCRHTNYSDYYKVFGTNHTRISRVSAISLEQEAKKRFPEVKDKNIKTIIDLCCGYPELADVILREINLDDQDSVNEYLLNNTYSAAFPFDRWIDCLSPDELLVLEKISKKITLEKELLFHKRKLLRKEVITENQQGEISFTSILFENYLMTRKPVTSSTNRVVIKRRGLLDSLHKELIEDLFSDRFLIELKLQQETLPGNAFVFMVTGEDEKGIIYRPCIVKVDDATRSKQENKNLDIAREMLGTIVPSILKRIRLRGQDAVILEYASADNKNYTVKQFAEFYQNQNIEEIVHLLKKVFDNALAPFYRTQKITKKDAKNLYFLPRLHHGEYDSLTNIAKRSRFYHSYKLLIPGSEQPLQDPGKYLRPSLERTTSNTNYEKFFLSKQKVGLSMAHGDLNPRNLLIDGIDNIHIIDFSELKQEGARFLDFARLESEIKFKLASINRDNLETFIALESMIMDSTGINQLERISMLPLDNEARKMISAIFIIRRIALSVCTEKPSYQEFNLEYFLCLLTQTLRISLFQDYISDVQQEFAIISASLLINKLEKLIPSTES